MFLILISICLIAFIIYRLLSNVWSVSGVSSRPVLITGCDTGFGHLLAIRLVQNGIPTFAGCLTEKGETELRKTVAGATGKLWTIPLDVTKEASLKSAFDFVSTQLGPGKGLWGLVNNAGILGTAAPDSWLTVDDYQKVLDVNCLGVIRTTQTFRSLVKMAKGRIVNITSIFGRFSIPGFAPYCVSKFAAEAYCNSLRAEMYPFEVSVHVIEPGVHSTSMVNSDAVIASFTDSWKRLNQSQRDEYGEEYFNGCADGLRQHFDFITADANRVVDAYYHALTSRLPKLRYVVGLDAMLCYQPLSLLPTWVGDMFLWFVLRIRNVPLPKSCQKTT